MKRALTAAAWGALTALLTLAALASLTVLFGQPWGGT